MLDASGILADEQLRKILNRTDNATGMPFQGGFAPPEEPRYIGEHFDKDPISHPSMTDERFNARYFHGVSSRKSR
jgi:hypothetical protein